MPEPKTKDEAALPAPNPESNEAAKAAEPDPEKSASPAKVKEQKDKVSDVKKADEASTNSEQQPSDPVPIGAIGAATASSDKPATTVFVGGINERAPNSMMRELLSVCGFVNSWKRVTGADGKLQSFGFCEFADPVATMICGRLLGQVDVAGKKLIVRVDSNSQDMLNDYKKRHSLPDAPDAEKDEETKRRFAQIVQRFMPEIERVEDGELDVRAPKLVGPKESLDDMDIDVDKRNIINREIEFFRSRYRDDSPKLDERLEREREREKERRRREKREKERERDRDKEREERRDQQGSSASASKVRSSTTTASSAAPEKSAVEADEEVAERRRIDKMLDKEKSYQQELKHWTQREKKKARDAEREREREEKRLAKEAHEAREMRNFLAEYDDELDDAKFYRGDAFRRRLRERDREREQDERDRAREREQVDEARRRLLAEGREPADVDAICAELDEARDAHLRRYLTSTTVSPNSKKQQQQPASPQQKQQIEEQRRDNAAAADVSVNGNGDSDNIRNEQRDNDQAHAHDSVQHDDDDDHHHDHLDMVCDEDDGPEGAQHQQPTQPAPPAPLPQQQQQQQPSQPARAASSHAASSQPAAYANEEEKKALIKQLIDGIPTAKDELFAYNLDWSIVDATLMQNRVKPWVNKKIIEYIGEEEAQLTEFVCLKVIGRTKPEDILNEMVLVLDDEAEVFVVKLWRLLIYETEAKKAGLVK